MHILYLSPLYQRGLATSPSLRTAILGIILSTRQDNLFGYVIWGSYIVLYFNLKSICEILREGLGASLIVGNIVQIFFYVKKNSHFMFSSVKTFHNVRKA